MATSRPGSSSRTRSSRPGGAGGLLLQPVVLRLLGARAWWMPAWLDRRARGLGCPHEKAEPTQASLGAKPRVVWQVTPAEDAADGRMNPAPVATSSARQPGQRWTDVTPAVAAELLCMPHCRKKGRVTMPSRRGCGSGAGLATRFRTVLLRPAHLTAGWCSRCTAGCARTELGARTRIAGSRLQRAAPPPDLAARGSGRTRPIGTPLRRWTRRNRLRARRPSTSMPAAYAARARLRASVPPMSAGWRAGLRCLARGRGCGGGLNGGRPAADVRGPKKNGSMPIRAGSRRPPSSSSAGPFVGYVALLWLRRRPRNPAAGDFARAPRSRSAGPRPRVSAVRRLSEAQR